MCSPTQNTAKMIFHPKLGIVVRFDIRSFLLQRTTGHHNLSAATAANLSNRFLMSYLRHTRSCKQFLHLTRKVATGCSLVRKLGGRVMSYCSNDPNILQFAFVVVPFVTLGRTIVVPIFLVVVCGSTRAGFCELVDLRRLLQLTKVGDGTVVFVGILLHALFHSNL